MASTEGAGTASSSSADAIFTPEFRKFAQEQLEAWKVPGISVGVVDGDNIFAEGFGFASLPDTPAKPETLWYAGSTTKAHLAAAIAYLIDSKEYPQLANGWSTTLSSIMREDFVLQDEWATAHLTLEDAVCHRTGFGAYDNPSVREIDGRQATVKELTRLLRHFPSWHEPRTKFVYCNFMYVVLSHAVETITGKPLEDTLRKVIWDPLGMSSTYYTVEDAQKAGGFADGYYYDDEAGKFELVPPLTLVEVSGAGAIISNTLDYCKWIKCLIHEDEPFTEAVHKDIRHPRFLAREPASTGDYLLYGLGWERTIYKGAVLYKHSGGVHNGSCMVMWLPEKKFGAVAFGNTANTSFVAVLALLHRLIDNKLGVPEDERFDFIKVWSGPMAEMTKEPEDLPKKVYSDLAETRLPPTFTTEELAGSYFHPGWGKLSLKEQTDSKNVDKKVLVGTKPELTWNVEVCISHASGEHWVATMGTLLNPKLPKEYLPARFSRGPNGKVSQLVIEWMDESTGKVQYDSVFKRVE